MDINNSEIAFSLKNLQKSAQALNEAENARVDARLKSLKTSDEIMLQSLHNADFFAKYREHNTVKLFTPVAENAGHGYDDFGPPAKEKVMDSFYGYEKREFKKVAKEKYPSEFDGTDEGNFNLYNKYREEFDRIARNSLTNKNKTFGHYFSEINPKYKSNGYGVSTLIKLDP
ncbi:hypothetical protein [Helcococcus ovis]|uniref:hypothetical protein n=1 Tax=Helcococcus ovis TaxID=72026 RepID=UPI0038BA3280